MRHDDMLRLITALENKFGKSWMDVVEHLRDANQLEAVERRIAAGDVDGAVTGVQEAAAKFATDINAGFVRSGQAAAKWLDSEVPDAIVRFDVTNARAVQYAQQNTLELVRGVTAEQRDVMRRVISDGVRAGDNPREVAKDLRASIGLTDYQAEQVASYRRLLEQGDKQSLGRALERELRDGRHDRAVETAMRNGNGLNPEQIDKMTDRYRTGWVNYRAETIARTESLRVTHQGTQELYRQAIANGDIDANSLVQEWNSTHDPRTRSSHRAMNGQKRSYGESFVTGAGVRLRYPGDPAGPPEETINCRCAVGTRMVDTARRSAAPVDVAPLPLQPLQSLPVPQPPAPPVLPPHLAPTPSPMEKAEAAFAVGDMQTGRAHLEDLIRNELGLAMPTSDSLAVTIEDTKAGGLRYPDGRIALPSATAKGIEQFAQSVAETPDLKQQLQDLSLEQSTQGKYKAGTPEQREMAFQSQYMKVMAHEVLHGMGPITWGQAQYVGSTALVEEVATETAARQFMRSKYGVDSSPLINGALRDNTYAKEIGDVLELISNFTGKDVWGEATQSALEEASLKYKKTSRSQAAPLRVFAQALADAIVSRGGTADVDDLVANLEKLAIRK